MDMPQPDTRVIERKTDILRCLQNVLPENAIIFDEQELRVYECDALTAYHCPPMLAVLGG